MSRSTRRPPVGWPPPTPPSSQSIHEEGLKDTAANRALYEQYRYQVATMDWFYPAGRLGEYRYYNMDQAIGAGLKLAERLVENVAINNV